MASAVTPQDIAALLLAPPQSIQPAMGNMLGAGSGYPSYTGGLSDPDWVKNLPLEYANFRRSENVEDRRGDSFVKNWGGAILADLTQQLPSTEELRTAVQHPLTPLHQSMAQPIPEETPVSIALGTSDLDRMRANRT